MNVSVCCAFTMDLSVLSCINSLYSTLEKTKLYQRPILKSLLSARFQRIGGGGGTRDLCHGKQRVSPFYHTSQLAHSEDFDFHNFSSPGFLMQKMTELKEPLQSNSSLVFTLLWLFLHLILLAFFFDITSEQSVETELANVQQRQKMIPFITCEASLGRYVCELVFVWIFGSKLIRSNNQSRATLWVLETCLIVGLLPLKIILITASLSSNTYNKAF